MSTWRIVGSAAPSTARLWQGGTLAEEVEVHRNVKAVVDAGNLLGVPVRPHEFPEGTRTAVDAALAIGVDLGQIVKSLVFCVDGEVVVALVSGSNLLDEGKLAAAAGGERAWREDAETVREATGFPVGGVPPFGHLEPLRVFVDADLLEYDEVWAAAGTPHVNFPAAPSALVRATAGVVCDLAR
ncbi:MAG TPA: YbaK/EbsC family protein [Acidimicrobiales bacterium]|nr:YbaK/EbsC family protein [Acidimicrobiales bacterium]